CARGGGGYSGYPLSNWFDVW
nr:immunoglobulin heavy chain junction region [Macaca mulatta]MOW75409.1 immunoglobulin heavy chain junction region [Macaca mulatta]MOW76143.1 immunoglobulin heavy chain junction region [Macaca mulatta]MOW76209.1 immunoglobulin heavy chain junction region [Macaca mulatta]MOW78358.1 immunoglobulin heavy chain junction region [Macaca mulatta]